MQKMGCFFIKTICIFLSFLMFFSGCSSKKTSPAPYEFKYAHGIQDYGFVDIGVCKKLMGEVYTLVIFMDDDESSWNDDARLNFYDKRYFPSINYLSRQAEKRGISLNLQSGQYTTRQDLKSPPRYNGILDTAEGLNNLDILEQAAQTLGFTDSSLMHKMLKYNLGVEQIAYVLAFNKPGRARAVYDATFDNTDSIEFVVAFSKGQDGKDYIGSAVLHELLHLFGATDLYDDNGIYKKRYKLCKKLFPNDIMLRSAIYPESLKIGALTECLIGWSEDFPEKCDCKEWWERG